ncbi:MAG TPA: hypothetical protein VIL74_23280 [Pyrinomonadaceae bacterium]|jgi:hypothetical protein
MEIGTSLLTGLISAALTAIVTYLATRSKIRLDLTVEYDKEIRKKRLELYEKLWKHLKPLARFSPEEKPTYALIKQTSETMRDWYFDEVGGIYLSKESREPYFNLKECLQEIIDDQVLKNSRAELSARQHAKVLNFGKQLRDSLSDDIDTRRESFLKRKFK